jgi:hypothetical protein
MVIDEILKIATLVSLDPPHCLGYRPVIGAQSFGIEGIEAACEDADGVVSERGRNSIKVLNLYDDNLRRARQDQQTAALTRYNSAYSEAILEGLDQAECKKRAWASVAHLRSPASPFSAAVDAALRSHFGPPP